MKKKIFVASREENEEEVIFQENEETVCKWYCAMFGYTYRVEYVYEKKIFVASRGENEEEVIFQANEETVCKWYCAMFGYTYRVDYIDIKGERQYPHMKKKQLQK